jgi:hypothetical protein
MYVAKRLERKKLQGIFCVEFMTYLRWDISFATILIDKEMCIIPLTM